MILGGFAFSGVIHVRDCRFCAGKGMFLDPLCYPAVRDEVIRSSCKTIKSVVPWRQSEVEIFKAI